MTTEHDRSAEGRGGVRECDRGEPGGQNEPSDRAAIVEVLRGAGVTVSKATKIALGQRITIKIVEYVLKKASRERPQWGPGMIVGELSNLESVAMYAKVVDEEDKEEVTRAVAKKAERLRRKAEEAEIIHDEKKRHAYKSAYEQLSESDKKKINDMVASKCGDLPRRDTWWPDPFKGRITPFVAIRVMVELGLTPDLTDLGSPGGKNHIHKPPVGSGVQTHPPAPDKPVSSDSPIEVAGDSALLADSTSPSDEWESPEREVTEV